MKQDWEIKKLGDVSLKISAGGDKPKLFSETITDICNIPVYANGTVNNGLCGYTNEAIIYDKCITISARGTIGFCCIRTEPFVPIVRLIVVVPKKEVSCEYLCYAVKNLKIINNGGTIPQLTVPMLKEYMIPVPERAEQERIVGELDCLSGIIAAKRAQLRELDTLAQSIFYTMFGDPITNDKGWQTKALGNVCVVNPLKKDTLADVQSDDFVSFIPMEDLSVKAGYVKSKQQRLCKDVQSSYTCFADNDILMAKVTPCFENGKVGITQNLVNGIGFGSSEFIVIRPVNVIKEYVYFVIQTPIFIDEAVKRLTGTSGLRRVPRTYVEECIISIPPIDLQKQFAEKIENIERQKELITKSIKETEDLFNSRMDYYFN